MASSRKRLTLATLATAALALAGCGLEVRSDNGGDRQEVDIRTPVGAVSVRTNVDAPATGLPAYPGARPLSGDDDSHSADVSVGNRFFGVQVVAARFESDDPPETIVEFYRREMAAYGHVMVCRGDADFRGRSASTALVCREKPSSRRIELAVGTKRDRRLVVVKPRGDGSELALVHIDTRS